MSEVWFKKGGQYDTSFVFHSSTRIEQKFDDFASFAQFLREPDKLYRFVGKQSKVKIFISHAHNDAILAKSLVTALELSFAVPDGSIRCTSVPSYKLDVGSTPRETLRQELRFAEAVVALVTPDSLKSPWVLFELGAAWLQTGRVLPILGGTLTEQDLPGPFKGDVSARLSDAESLDDLLAQLASSLGWIERNRTLGRDFLRSIHPGAP